MEYRKHNFISDATRVSMRTHVHPEVLKNIKKIAKAEKKTVSWVLDKVLLDYFGIEEMLRKCKNPKPAYGDK